MNQYTLQLSVLDIHGVCPTDKIGCPESYSIDMKALYRAIAYPELRLLKNIVGL